MGSGLMEVTGTELRERLQAMVKGSELFFKLTKVNLHSWDGKEPMFYRGCANIRLGRVCRQELDGSDHCDACQSRCYLAPVPM